MPGGKRFYSEDKTVFSDLIINDRKMPLEHVLKHGARRFIGFPFMFAVVSKIVYHLYPDFRSKTLYVCLSNLW